MAREGQYSGNIIGRKACREQLREDSTKKTAEGGQRLKSRKQATDHREQHLFEDSTLKTAHREQRIENSRQQTEDKQHKDYSTQDIAYTE